jgi:hypothetical protein
VTRFILFYTNRKKVTYIEQIKLIALYLGVSILSSYILLLLMYGSFYNYILSLKINSIDDHGLVNLIKPLITRTLSFFCYPAMLWCSFELIDKTFNNKKRLATASIFIIAVLYYYLCCDHDIQFSLTQQYTIAFALIMMGACLYFNRTEEMKGRIIALFLLACVPFLGSNGGIIKFVALPIIPILYIYLRPYINKKMKLYGVLCSIALVAYASFGLPKNGFADVGITDSTYEFKDGLLVGLRTTPQKAESINAVIADMKPYEEYRKVILRKGANYVYEYLYMSRNAYNRHRFSGGDNNSPDYVKWIENEILKQNDNVVVLFFDDESKQSLMTTTLDSLCFKTKETPYYTIYTKIKQ